MINGNERRIALLRDGDTERERDRQRKRQRQRNRDTERVGVGAVMALTQDTYGMLITPSHTTKRDMVGVSCNVCHSLTARNRPALSDPSVDG